MGMLAMMESALDLSGRFDLPNLLAGLVARIRYLPDADRPGSPGWTRSATAWVWAWVAGRPPKPRHCGVGWPSTCWPNQPATGVIRAHKLPGFYVTEAQVNSRHGGERSANLIPFP